jgi:hypothetical protein
MDYIAEASLTKSDQFHGDKVSLAEFTLTIGGAITYLNRLDKIKKALFYGKTDDVNEVDCLREYDCSNIPLVFGPDKQKAIDIIHAIIGKATESCELLELLQNTINGEAFDATNFREELGDGMWYDAIGLKAVDGTFEAEQVRNIQKLRSRYPNKFTEYDAVNRDLKKERDILEKGE